MPSQKLLQLAYFDDQKINRVNSLAASSLLVKETRLSGRRHSLCQFFLGGAVIVQLHLIKLNDAAWKKSKYPSRPLSKMHNMLH